MLFDLWDQSKIQKSKHDKVFNTETMLPVSEIKWDTIILKDGWLRAIIKVDGLNLDLKNFDEQQIVLEQYKRFLNGLDFPVQILIRNSYLDLSDYLNYMKANVERIENKTLKGQWDEYLKFLEDIDLKQGLIYTKEFYIVVPYYEGEQDNKQIRKPWRNKLMDVLQAKDNVEKIVSRYRLFIKGRKMLETRCNLLIDGLAAIGIPTDKLGLSGIVSLLFRCYNPLLHSSQSKLNDK